MQSQVSNEIPEIRLPFPSPELRSSLFSGRLSLCFCLLSFNRACPSQVATKRDECKGNDDWMRFSWEGSHPSGQWHISGARPLWVRLPFYNHEAHMPFPSWASGMQLQAPAWVRGRGKWQRVCHSTSWLALLQCPAFMGGRGSPAVRRTGQTPSLPALSPVTLEEWLDCSDPSWHPWEGGTCQTPCSCPVSEEASLGPHAQDALPTIAPTARSSFLCYHKEVF